MAEAFIKLYKKLLKWEWYDDSNTCRLFIHCLLKANWELTRWHGIELLPGQFVTSTEKLAAELGLTNKQVRTALKHLVETGEVASKGHSKYTVITVNNWSEYQGKGQTKGKETASKGQTEGNQRATVKEYKEYKNNKNKKPNSFYDFKSKGYDYEALQEEALNV